MTDTTTYWTMIDSPLGPLLLTAGEAGISGVIMDADLDEQTEPSAGWVEDPARFEEARRQLEEYFAGERTSFDIRVAPPGTPFRQRVWDELQRIEYGHTITYAELAARSGRPAAIRAAGAANGANPVSIVIPCHRVIGSNGSLTGYSGGLEAKRFLLDLERSRA